MPMPGVPSAIRDQGEQFMLTRRDFVAGAIATGALLHSAGERAFAKASQPSTAVNFDVPPHACDCHTHYYGSPQKFPLSPQHVNTPEGTVPEEMSALHRALRIERVVIVTPSVYGTDNSSTLYGMKARGATARGIAVVDEKTPDAEFDSMYRAGVRGARIVSGGAGPTDPAAVRPLYQTSMDRFKNHKWMMELYTNLAVISGIKDLVRKSPVPTVFDHFGGVQTDLGMQQPGFADLLELVKSGSAYVKISAPYRSSKKGPDYPDIAPFAKAFIEANPDRILWGSDWPHPDSTSYAGRKPSDTMPLYNVDDGLLLNQLPLWAPDPAIRRKILVDNPARLYGF
jgi:predicted TIM-barrel fold metal-dependent hydrolase